MSLARDESVLEINNAQKNKEENKNNQSEQNPLDIPEICQALELFPNEDPEKLYATYIECGKSKEWFLESLMSNQSGKL